MARSHLQQLQDRIDIEWNLHEYCRTIDLMDLEALTRVFADDCFVEYGDGEPLKSRGKVNLIAGLQRMWRFTRTSHHLSNVQISLTDDTRAGSTSYYIAWHEYPDGQTTILYGQYIDEHVLTPRGWRISRRKLLLNGNGPEYTVPLYRLARHPPPPGWTNPLAG